jgi:hypothetical protein
MNGFRCKVTGSVSNAVLAPAKVPRRCGADPERGVTTATPGNCTYGAKQPFYWFQKERNNVRARRFLSFKAVLLMSSSPVQMFEGTYSPPFYLDLYNFRNGSQDDIFLDSYTSIPPPSPTQRQIPTPVNHTLQHSSQSSQPSPTSGVGRSCTLRTAREPSMWGSLFKTLFSMRATYSREVF